MNPKGLNRNFSHISSTCFRLPILQLIYFKSFVTIYSFSVHSCYISFCPLTVLKHRISFVRHNEVMTLKYNIKKYSAGNSETLWVESSLNRISADKSISKLMMNHFDKLSSVTENLSIFYFKSTQGLEGIRSLSRVFKYILLSLYPFLASDQ